MLYFSFDLCTDYPFKHGSVVFIPLFLFLWLLYWLSLWTLNLYFPDKVICSWDWPRLILAWWSRFVYLSCKVMKFYCQCTILYMNLEQLKWTLAVKLVNKNMGFNACWYAVSSLSILLKWKLTFYQHKTAYTHSHTHTLTQQFLTPPFILVIDVDIIPSNFVQVCQKPFPWQTECQRYQRRGRVVKSRVGWRGAHWLVGTTNMAKNYKCNMQQGCNEGNVDPNANHLVVLTIFICTFFSYGDKTIHHPDNLID